jgi:PKD repeat protein
MRTARARRPSVEALEVRLALSPLLLHSVGTSAAAVAPLCAHRVAPSGATITARPPGGVAPLTVTFTAAVAAGTQPRYRWDFGDGTPAGHDRTTAHAYRSPGVYTVTLTASNAAGRATANTRVAVSAAASQKPDRTAPTVTGETPAPGATSVAPDTSVTATFSESVQAGTVTFALKDPSGTAVPASVGYSNVTHTATLQPSSPLAASTTYTATVSAAKDLAGNALAAPVSWSFTTTAATPSVQYYVSKTGNDSNAGTIAAPWRTIQHAMNVATAGSTVNIMAGTYSERLKVNVSGGAGNSITFQPYGFSGGPNCGGSTGVACGGDQVILDYSSLGTDTSGIPYLEIDNQSYVVIQGLTFQNYQTLGAMQRGGWIHGTSTHDIQFKHNKVLTIQNKGAWDGTNALLGFWIDGGARNVWVYENEMGNIVSNYGEAMTTSGAFNVTIENNWFHDTDGIAIDIQKNGSNTIVRGNLVEWSSKKRDGSAWYSYPSNAIYVDGGNTAIIERNIVRDSGWGYAVLSEPGNPAAHDITVRNNLGYRLYGGIEVGTWYSTTDGSSVYNVDVHNNTISNSQYGLVIRPYTSASVAWKNNIVVSPNPYQNTLGWPVGTMDYNLYSGGTATGPDAHKITANPLFTNPGAATPDLTLQVSSPAINAGDPAFTVGTGEVDFAGNPRLVGGRVDMGAYEAR